MVLNTGLPEITNRDMESECKDVVWTISKEKEVKAYSYDEAVDLTGHGPYSILLLVSSAFSLLGLTLDMFALPAISSIAACDLELGRKDEKILLSIPFLGAIIMAYPWGYVSDTRGRRFEMLVAMWVSFLTSCLAAFSPHWIALAILKFISVSCSSCTQSAAYTLIGESCGTKVKSVYFFIMTSIIHVGFPFQMALHYLTLTLDFSMDLGLVTFVPWRLLAIVLAVPLAASAICLHFVYESPRFLANAGKEEEAVKILAKIWKRNRQPGKLYPVEKLILNEENNSIHPDESFLQSLWNQTAPLIKKPLVYRTLQLYFIVYIIYGACGGLLGWFPFLANAYISGSMTNQNGTEGLCNMISHYKVIKDTDHGSVTCIPKSDLIVVWASSAQAMILVIINCSISFLADRRKLLVITTLLIPSLAAMGCAVLPSNVASLTSYFAIFLAVIGIGLVQSYFVDLYPTSYRGMASCLAVMVARLSNLVEINIVGSMIMDHCDGTFYMISAMFLSGVIAASFLPSDRPKKSL